MSKSNWGPGSQRPPGADSAALTARRRAEQFSAQFAASFRTLWLLAAGIVRDSAAAEDVVQEAAIIALGKLDQFEPGTNFTAWMGQIIRFVALNQSRKERRRRTAATDPATLDETAPAAAAGLASGSLIGRSILPPDQPYFDDRVMVALREVNEVARACLLLRTVDELSYAEIAALLGIPEGTAMSHVHRTRQHLREKLGAAPSDAAPVSEA
jgi:RNA polymerase sigma-70 factor (ECF subfamily)